MSKVCLVVLCGLPAAGKTQVAKQLYSWPSLTQQPPFKYIRIEYDRLLPPDVEKALIETEEQAQISWKNYRAEILVCVDILLSHILDSKRLEKVLDIDAMSTSTGSVHQDLWQRFLKMIHDTRLANVDVEDTVCVVIDDNMYYRSMRYAYHQLARKYTIGFCEIYIQLDVKTAILHNQQRDVKVNDDIIVAMADKMEAPDSENHKWENNSICFTSDVNIEAVHSLIKRALENPVQPAEEPDLELQNQSRLVCSENFLYQSDIILRRLVSKEMALAKERNVSKSEMKTLASSLQSARKLMLSDLKSGALHIPSYLVSMAANASRDLDSEPFHFLQEKFQTYLKDIQLAL